MKNLITWHDTGVKTNGLQIKTFTHKPLGHYITPK